MLDGMMCFQSALRFYEISTVSDVRSEVGARDHRDYSAALRFDAR